MVWKAANVSIENLTACNFLGGKGDAGNEIWWNGGANSGKIGGHGFYGSYLTTTSTYLRAQRRPRAAVRDLLQQLDRRYVGPDLRLQLQRLRLLHRRLPADLQPDAQPRLGRVQRARLLRHQLRRPAAGRELAVRQQQGRLRHQQRERRRAGAPERRLPGHGVKPRSRAPTRAGSSSTTTSTTTTTPTCPRCRRPARRPVGTGMSLSGGRNDTIMDNRFVNNNAWGMLIQPQQGEGGPPCDGGTLNFSCLGVTLPCLWDDYGKRDPQQHVLAQRLLRARDQRRLRPGQLLECIRRPTATAAT